MKKIFYIGTSLLVIASFLLIGRDAVMASFTSLMRPDSTIASPSQINRIQKEFHNAKSKTVLVVAHRGDWKGAPENSLSSIKSCIQMGVDIVEIDVQKTKDGVLILMHDPKINRTTTGKGKVASLTYAKIQKYKLRMNGGGVTNERVPTLEEALLLAKGNCMLNLDKANRYMDECVELMIKTGTLDIGIMKGMGDGLTIRNYMNKFPQTPVFMPILVSSQSNNLTRINGYINHMEPPAYEVIFKYDNDSIISSDYIYLMKKNNARIWVNAMFDNLCAGYVERYNPEASWGWMIDRGVNIIQTDEPQMLLNYLRKRKLHW